MIGDEKMKKLRISAIEKRMIHHAAKKDKRQKGEKQKKKSKEWYPTEAYHGELLSSFAPFRDDNRGKKQSASSYWRFFFSSIPFLVLNIYVS